MRRVRLNQLKRKERFEFSSNVQKELGVHGVFWVSARYGDKMARVRKVSSEKEYLIKLLQKTTLIKDWKTGKKMEFPGEILVIVD